MLDFRYETFLTLCETKNFTKTANLLHITQPAVSQHIKFLEKKYNTKLFKYKSKTLYLTEKGNDLRKFVLYMRSNSEKISEFIQKPYSNKLRFGATLSIGEYIIPKILSNYLREHPKLDLSMTVDNTTSLLNKLNHGEIDFALIEGIFPKNDYEYKLLSKENFIPICSPLSKFHSGYYSLNDIFSSRIIIREKGSGTRNILENVLYENSLSINNFSSIIEINNFPSIKQLVSENIGISFVFEKIVAKELENHSLVSINILNFQVLREFNFVYLKNSIFEKDYLDFYSYCKKLKNK